jgi:cytochrome c-type biogenesis protein
MRVRKLVPILVIVAVLIAAALYLGFFVPSSRGHATPTAVAPSFTLTDIYGHTFNLSDYRNKSVVVTEFTSLSCAECQIVMQSLRTLYATYNATGTSSVHIVSVYTEPQFGDSIPALKSYHTKNNITWTMAQDTNSLAVSQAYGVTALPTVVIIDKQGHLVYDVTGVQDANKLQSTIAAALAGTAAAISLVTVSVFALAAIAGVSTFFSPCAFPMLPGYMGLFLGLNARQSDPASPSSATYRGAARRAVVAGSVTATGMIVVFSVVGIALILAASLVSGYIPDLLIAVGVVLIALGALLLTNLQYWRIVKPLQSLWHRLGGKGAEETLASPTPVAGKGLYVKLFSYGMGYAAAAAGCVFPVIFSAIVAGLALGLTGGIINILIFSLTAAVLMIAVTLMLALAGKKYVNQLKAFSPIIKKVSAVVLVIVGVYLVYFYYTAWIA